MQKLFVNNTLMNTNNLINENSPYLLQHAHNPIDWYAWNETSLTKAKEENKPVFLSIGYSACHWCHVMEKESFEDKEVAEILNKSFVAIKVDREERPDIDSVYMDFCQRMTGSGGWPLTIIMTPDGKPFFAGTYLPKKSAFGRTGLVELLTAVEQGWENKRDVFVASAEDILSKISGNRQTAVFGDLVKKTYEYLNYSFDSVYGGFGNSPKFPMPSHLKFLIEYYKKYGDDNALIMLQTTLISMYKSGIFDHIGYGFFRYSTDEKWLVPHFEKMLYDNALLIDSNYGAYDITKNELYKKIADKCILYVIRDLKGASGGFYSSQDADSDGGEGSYYLFGYEEIFNILPEYEALEFINDYSITRKGNFEGENIPNLLNKNNGENYIDKDKSKLYEYRKNRRNLLTDDKIITSWNCLLISAFCTAYKVTLNKEYLIEAKDCYNFIINNLTDGKNVFTCFRQGKKTPNGFLDDYAALIYACISLYKVTLDVNYLEKADYYLAETVKEFYDTEKGGFYLNKESDRNLVFRPKEYYDGVTPAGNSLMYYNLFYLSELERLAPEMKEVYVMTKNYLDREFTPGGQSFYAHSMIIGNNYSKVVAVVKNEEDREKLIAEKPEILKFDIIKVICPNENYSLKNNQTTFYVCKNNACYPPSNQL